MITKPYTIQELKKIAVEAGDKAMQSSSEKNIPVIVGLMKNNEWKKAAEIAYTEYLHCGSVGVDNGTEMDLYTPYIKSIYELQSVLGGIYFLETGERLEK